jgi:hypothetical protein
MKYFAKLNFCHSTKNKAHKEIQDYARKVDYTLISSKEALSEFKAEFKKFVDEVNRRHTRYQDIHLSINDYTNVSISVESNFIMSVYEVKQEK